MLHVDYTWHLHPRCAKKKPRKTTAELAGAWDNNLIEGHMLGTCFEEILSHPIQSTTAPYGRAVVETLNRTVLPQEAPL